MFQKKHRAGGWIVARHSVRRYLKGHAAQGPDVHELGGGTAILRRHARPKFLLQTSTSSRASRSPDPSGLATTWTITRRRTEISHDHSIVRILRIRILFRCRKSRVKYLDGGSHGLLRPERFLRSTCSRAACSWHPRFSARRERFICEQLGNNLFWLWFLDCELDESSFDPTVFTHNSKRVLSAEAAKLFFVEIYDFAREEGWTSSEHFTADGTLIEAWASIKSFARKDRHDQNT